MSPLCLGGPALEVDTSGPVDVTAVATWVRQQPEWHLISAARIGKITPGYCGRDARP